MWDYQRAREPLFILSLSGRTGPALLHRLYKTKRHKETFSHCPELMTLWTRWLETLLAPFERTAIDVAG